MGNPLQHSESSARKFGGVVDDYIKIHQIMDISKRYLADWRHRALFHTTFGVHMMEEFIIGPTFTRKDGIVMDTRTVVSEHIKEDMAGVIPTPAEFLREMPIMHWMSGVKRAERKRMQNLSIAGSEELPVVKEDIVWISRDSGVVPDIDGHYLCQYADTSKVGSCTFKEGKFFSPSPIKYWAEFPIGP